MRKIVINSLRLLLGLVVALAALVLAWLASNNRWVDAAPAPVPEALRLQESRLPVQRNGFFALLGLDAAEGVDPAVEGLQRWRDPHAPRAAAALRWPGRDGRASPVWNCSSDRDDCAVHWRREAAALTELIRSHASLGARCEKLAMPSFEMEEQLARPRTELRVPSDQYTANMPAPHGVNAIGCLRWAQVQAVLAEQRGEPMNALANLQRADQLMRALLRGSRSLAGASIAWNAAALQGQLVTAMAAANPALLPEFAGLLQALPEEARDPSFWIASEAFFARQVNRELGLGCSVEHADATTTPGARLQCSPGLTFMPNATQELMDSQWQQALTMARGDVLNLLDWQPQPQGVRVLGMAWRNSIGHLLVDVAMPAYQSYPRRQANVLLQHEAARLALAAAAQAPAQRSAWLAQQKGIAPRLLERLQIDGDHVLARGWSAAGDEQRTYRYPIPNRLES